MVVNSTLSSNGFGIVLSGSSKNNTIVNNTLSSNAWGVYFGDYANSNLIYNNYFKNTINVFFETSRPNTWNTVKTAGINIIGGSYLGGNYWSSPDERGFSDTCSDRDSDGICDEPLIIDENNIDYYPLKPAQPQSSTPTPTLTTTPTPLPTLIIIGVILAVITIIVLVTIRKIKK